MVKCVFAVCSLQAADSATSQAVSWILRSSINSMANICLMMLYVCFLLVGKLCLPSSGVCYSVSVQPTCHKR